MRLVAPRRVARLTPKNSHKDLYQGRGRLGRKRQIHDPPPRDSHIRRHITLIYKAFSSIPQLLT